MAVGTRDLDQAEHSTAGRSASRGIRIGKEEVFARDSGRLGDVLGADALDRDATGLAILSQSVGVLDQVGRGIMRSGVGYALALHPRGPGGHRMRLATGVPRLGRQVLGLALDGIQLLVMPQAQRHRLVRRAAAADTQGPAFAGKQRTALMAMVEVVKADTVLLAECLLRQAGGEMLLDQLRPLVGRAFLMGCL
jgi:hypothetical protein